MGGYLFLTACVTLTVGFVFYNRRLSQQDAVAIIEKIKKSPKPALIAGIAVIGILCLAFMFGIGGGSNEPTTVVKKFVAAVKKGDYATVGKYSTPDTMQLLTRSGDQVKNRMQMVGKITSCKITFINEYTARVSVTFENDKDPPDFVLEKIDGKWKVRMR